MSALKIGGLSGLTVIAIMFAVFPEVATLTCILLILSVSIGINLVFLAKDYLQERNRYS